MIKNQGILFKIAIFLIAFNLSATLAYSFQDKYTNKNTLLSSSRYNELFSQGEELKHKGNYKKAITLFGEALKIAIKHNSPKEEILSLLKLAILNWNIGNTKESDNLYSQVFSIASNKEYEHYLHFSESALEISRLYSKAKESRLDERFEDSLALFQKAIDISKKINSAEHEIKCLRQMSATYWDQNDLKNYFILNNAALRLSRIINHKIEEGRSLNNLGLYYWKIDNYAEALNHYDQSLKIAANESNLIDQADSLYNIGGIFKDIGEYEKSLEYSLKALEIDQILRNKNSIAMDLNNIGITYRRKWFMTENKDDMLKSLKYFNDSILLAKETDDKKTLIDVTNNIGTIYSDLKEYGKSLEYFTRACKIAEERRDRESASMIYNNMGIVQFNLGNFEESTKLYQKAIDLALEFQGGQVLWEAYLESANAYKKHQMYAEALQNYKNSISVIENIRSSINMEEYKAIYLGVNKRIEAYQNIIDLLYILKTRFPDRHYDQEAFDYLEKAKARAFLDSLEVSSVNVSQGIDMKLSNREKEVARDISKLYTKLLMPELSDDERKTAIEQLKSSEEKYEELKREIRATSPAYANLRYPKSLTYKEIERNILDSGVAYFCYSIGKEKSYGFVLSERGLKMFPIPSRQDIQNQVIEYRRAISDKENRDFRLGKELFKELVLPGLDQEIKKIIIIPDDVLNMLPFETLITDEKAVHWLIQDYSISYAPSISSLRELDLRNGNKRNRSQKDIIAFGDPYYGSNEEDNTGYGTDLFRDFYSAPTVGFFRLRFSGLETQKISSLFKPAKRDVYLRESASEEQLKSKNLADYKIIHFATHGLIDDKKPARSSIILSLDRDPTEDGFLQMREIINLNMHADLVTLSACQTGLGQFIRGEGIEGLSRAFFYAGASSVLMSLWAVNDEATYQLMERFYYHLRSSRSLMNALRIAKLEMINSSALSHPYYWAGFIISGKTDRPVFPRKIENWLLLASSLCVGAMIFFVVKVSARRHNKNREQSDML